jgi:hypothetical protein
VADPLSFGRGVARGTVQGVSGRLRLSDGGVAGEDVVQTFAAGSGTYGSWDERVAFARRCADDTDCTAGKVDPCLVFCAPQEGRCLVAPAARPDGTPCTTWEGVTGECCGGGCQPAPCR